MADNRRLVSFVCDNGIRQSFDCGGTHTYRFRRYGGTVESRIWRLGLRRREQMLQPRLIEQKEALTLLPQFPLASFKKTDYLLGVAHG